MLRHDNPEEYKLRLMEWQATHGNTGSSAPGMVIYGKATEAVPAYVNRILAGEILEAEDIWADADPEYDD